jgi:hypothetical protein
MWSTWLLLVGAAVDLAAGVAVLAVCLRDFLE